jgi:hypothetical protein
MGINGDNIEIYFLLGSDDLHLQEAINDFEESLYTAFGRQNLVARHYMPGDPLPDLTGCHAIFDNRGK